MTPREEMLEIGERAKVAKRDAAKLSTKQKNNILEKISKLLIERQSELIRENEKDVKFAKENNLSEALIDRLILNEKRIKGMAKAIEVIRDLSDPIGEIEELRTIENGAKVGKMRVPIGVIGVIYESRPNVTSDIAGLTIKSSNVVILRGGKESINSNKAIHNIIQEAIKSEGVNPDIVLFIDKTDRTYIYEMLKLDGYIDLIIPRGGEGLIKTVSENTKIPVIKHDKGVCYLYVDKSAPKDMAIKVVVNAKVQRPGVCNAIEGLVVHKDFPYKKELFDALNQEGVEIRGDERVLELAPYAIKAKEEDYSTEYLALILSAKIVDSIDEAIAHINKYSSEHTDGIISEDYTNITKFLKEVDSSCITVNASTRLHDGGVFGLGAELGISTNKLHARGTMGVRELTTQKYVVFGHGEIRE